MASRYLLSLLAAATVAIGAQRAAAQDAGGFYVEAFGGASLLGDTDVTGAVGGAASFSAGPVTGAAVGYDYADSPFRSELEFAYRSGDADPFAGGATGDFASTTVMVNGYYDFSATGPVTPYVGAGVGYVTEIDFDLTGGAAPGGYNDTGGAAFQAMAGATYAVTDSFGISGELRYFTAGSRTLTSPAGSITADYATLEAVIGLSFRF